MSQTKNMRNNVPMESLINDKPSYFIAYLAVIATSLLHLSNGAVLVWSSPIMPQLNLTVDEKTLVGSLFSLGAAPGPFIVTLFIDLIGRKGTLYVLCSTFVTSWILLLSSQNVNVIYIARIIGGIGVGGCCSGIPVVVAELAIKDIRGRLGSMSFFFILFGTLIVYGIGPYVGYYFLSVYGLSIALIFAIAFFFVPESPYYYLRKGRRADAKQALLRIRRYATEEALEEEFAEIKKAVLTHADGNFESVWEAISKRAALKGIGIAVFLVLMQQSSGVHAINAFCQEIFEHAELNFSATVVPMIIVVSGIFGFLSVVIVNRCLTMKIAFVISGFATGIGSALVGLYFFLLNNGEDLYDISYISVALLFITNLAYNLGVAPLTWPLIAEILPTSIKGIGTGISGCISALAGFVIIALFSIISEKYGYSTSFFGCAVFMSTCSVLAVFIVPDTTGKSLQEIQEMLSKN